MLKVNLKNEICDVCEPELIERIVQKQVCKTVNNRRQNCESGFWTKKCSKIGANLLPEALRRTSFQTDFSDEVHSVHF